MNPDQNNNYWQPQPPEPTVDTPAPQQTPFAAQPVAAPQPVPQQPAPQPYQQPQYTQPQAQPQYVQPTPQPEYIQPQPEQPAPQQFAQSEPQQPIAPPQPEITQPEVQPQPAPEDVPVTWTAQEYVHAEKNALWYVLFAIIALGLIAIDIFLIKTFLYTFSLLVVVMVITIIVYSRRPPRTLTYALSSAQGLYVGEKLYHLDEFKAFGLIKDQGHHSILLIPRKRFALGVSVFFPEEAGERIVEILGKRLPMENLKLDAIDAVVRKLRL